MNLKNVQKRENICHRFLSRIKKFIINLYKNMTKNKADQQLKTKTTSPERRAPEPVTKQEMQKSFNELIFYILTDAYEKAEEIDIRTEEDFLALKKRFFNQIKVKIDEEYDKKIKRHHQEQELQVSRINHQVQMDILQGRRELLKEFQDEIMARIREDMANEERYANILYLLIMEGLFMLMEMVVFLRCRKDDICLVASLIPHCKEIYENTSKKSIEIYIDNTSCLPDSSLGGIQLTIEGERVFIENTLEKRLEQILLKSIPPMKVHLLGQKVHNLQL